MELDDTTEQGVEASDTRRKALKKIAAGGAILWAVPLVKSMPASARPIGSFGPPGAPAPTTTGN